MLDVIILTKTSTPQHQAMVERCIKSYLQDGDEFITSIILVESCRTADVDVWSKMSSKIKVLVPPYKFNYNLFLNIALEHCTGSVVCISNNDVEAKPGCIKNMLAVMYKLPTLMSASPVDRTWNNSYQMFPQDDQIYPGYTTTQHLLGFCIFAKRQVFDIIGKFDERFHFYHQDNDYENCLRHNNLTHALVTLCHIQHGHDKPESDESGEQVRAKLLRSQSVFYNKWQSLPYTEKFVKYHRLSIVTDCKFDLISDLIEIVSDVTEATGRHIMASKCALDATQQQRLLDVLAHCPDKIIIDNFSIIRRF